jgi:GTP cyclohydrolase I
MNKNGTIVNGKTNGYSMEDMAFEIGEQHAGTSYDTPLRKDAFDKTDDEKIRSISWHFEKIMETLGLDLNEDSLRGTPFGWRTCM